LSSANAGAAKVESANTAAMPNRIFFMVCLLGC
jgi:hypothetical protein